MCNCQNVCRTWEETKGGKYPPSEHAPMCEDYKLIHYKRIIYDGVSMICDFDHAMDFMDSVKYDEDAELYEYEDVYLTQDQYDKLEEFKGF
jgi:hypothetical protein